MIEIEKKKKKEIKIKICTNHGILQQMFKKKKYARLNTLDCKKKKIKTIYTTFIFTM